MKYARTKFRFLNIPVGTIFTTEFSFEKDVFRSTRLYLNKDHLGSPNNFVICVKFEDMTNDDMEFYDFSDGKWKNKEDVQLWEIPLPV